jgi:uncharacterized protein (DUF302 family)
MRAQAVIAFFLLMRLVATVTAADGAGLIGRESPYSNVETVERIESILAPEGVKVFARIDHGSEAAAAGLDPRPTVLLIVGNPGVGTPLVDAAPSMGIDLPVRALVRQDDHDRAHVVWNDPITWRGATGRTPVPPRHWPPWAA